MFLFPVDEKEVLNSILKTCGKHSCGVDEIPSNILKKVENTILSSLSHIINISFLEGSFPEKLKISKITPVFKKGSKADLENYRPIAVQSCFSKVFESIMHLRVVNYLEVYSPIHAAQHGFVKSRSTKTAIVEILNEIYHHLYNKS